MRIISTVLEVLKYPLLLALFFLDTLIAALALFSPYPWLALIPIAPTIILVIREENRREKAKLGIRFKSYPAAMKEYIKLLGKEQIEMRVCQKCGRQFPKHRYNPQKYPYCGGTLKTVVIIETENH